jgi:hypothetical protein
MNVTATEYSQTTTVIGIRRSTQIATITGFFTRKLSHTGKINGRYLSSEMEYVLATRSNPDTAAA